MLDCMTKFQKQKRLEALVGAVLLLFAFIFLPMGYSRFSELGAGVNDTFNAMDENSGVLPQTAFVETYTAVGIDFSEKYQQWKIISGGTFEEGFLRTVSILGFYSIANVLNDKHIKKIANVAIIAPLGYIIFLWLVFGIWRWNVWVAYVGLILSVAIMVVYFLLIFVTLDDGLVSSFKADALYAIYPIWWAWLIVFLLYGLVIQGLPWWRNFSKEVAT